MADKVKNFFAKKVSSPFGPSTFRGQGHVLGSADPSSSPAASASAAAAARFRPSAPPPPPRTSNPSAPPPQSLPDSAESTSGEFTPFAPFIASTATYRRRAPVADGPPGEKLDLSCPICGESGGFRVEADVDTHLDACAPVRAYLASAPPDSAVGIVVILLKNIIREPGNEKYRRIRLGNAKIKEAVENVEGGIGLIEAAGFRVKEEEGETYAVVEGVLEDGRLMVAREMVALLERSRQPKNVEVVVKDEKMSATEAAGQNSKVQEAPNGVKTNAFDRQIQVFYPRPGSVTVETNLPDSFYTLSNEEMTREARLKKERLEQSRLLIPKSYKEKQALAARNKYEKAVLRIQFPDEIILQATFLPWEPTSAIYEFVSSALKEPQLEFELLRPAAPKLRVVPCFPNEGENVRSLQDEELVPSAILKFKPKETDSVAFTGLTDELLETSMPLTTPDNVQ